MKKEYIKPQMEIVAMESGEALLSGSGDNQWWKEPPEPEEGCESAWWCK